jgi:hypothetical protein
MDANSFTDRKLNRIPKAEYDRLWAKGYLPESAHELADDWIMVISEGAMDVKYGRNMYSPSLDQFRHSTMGEFYGSGIVD